MSLLEDLVLEAKELDTRAKKIQISTGNASVVGTNWSVRGIDEFANEYYIWYANCLD